MRITVEVDVETPVAQQIKRNGCTIYRSGTYHRVRVADRLLARDQAKITFEEIAHGTAQKPEAP